MRECVLDKQKAQAFIQRLLINPSLQGMNTLQKEEQILQFLYANLSALMPTLQSPAFFPGEKPQEIQKLLINTVFEITDHQLLPEIQEIISQTDLTFLDLVQQQRIPHDEIRKRISSFVNKHINKLEYRRQFVGSFGALKTNFINAYIDEVFRHRSYVHFELTKVERLRMGPEEIKNYISFLLLLRPIVSLFSVSGESHHDVNSGIFPLHHIKTIVPKVKQELRYIPEAVLISALHSSVSFQEHPKQEATARLAGVVSSRCRFLKLGQKIDKGAESMDKSWYSIVRRNFQFYGFDIKVIDELYRIASENGW